MVKSDEHVKNVDTLKLSTEKSISWEIKKNDSQLTEKRWTVTLHDKMAPG